MNLLVKKSMIQMKNIILEKLCYTKLVYGRVNKKLKTNFSNAEIENIIFQAIKDAPDNSIKKVGKNFYISNIQQNINITINSNTYRLITVDKI